MAAVTAAALFVNHIERTVMQTAIAADRPSFDEWRYAALELAKTSDQRLGQALFNTAPELIRAFTRSVMELDPFYADGPETMYVIVNFLTFAELCWDVTDTDELELGRKMVMDLPNARRR